MDRVKRVDEGRAARQREAGIKTTPAEAVQQGHLGIPGQPSADEPGGNAFDVLFIHALSRLAEASFVFARLFFALARSIGAAGAK